MRFFRAAGCLDFHSYHRVGYKCKRFVKSYMLNVFITYASQLF